MKKIYVDFNLDYIIGRLRYGHKEGEIELTDEEYESLLNAENKNDFLLSIREEEIRSLDTLVDDYEIDEYGGLSLLDWEER